MAAKNRPKIVKLPDLGRIVCSVNVARWNSIYSLYGGFNAIWNGQPARIFRDSGFH
jgi:hypothetical protein